MATWPGFNIFYVRILQRLTRSRYCVGREINAQCTRGSLQDDRERRRKVRAEKARLKRDKSGTGKVTKGKSRKGTVDREPKKRPGPNPVDPPRYSASDLKEHFVRTHYAHGLTDERAQEAIRLLQLPQSRRGRNAMASMKLQVELFMTDFEESLAWLPNWASSWGGINVLLCVPDLRREFANLFGA